MRLLIVEDDVALGTFLRRGMEHEGHEVRLATDGEVGLREAMEDAPDLMVLDLSLPRMDGMQVLELLDGRLRGTSVLVLTGRAGVEDRVRCLNLGADDCLVKPFSFSELSARCRALLRRRGQMAHATLQHGGVALDRMTRRVSRDGREVELTGKEFALLEFLMQARGRCCTRGELLRDVWQMSPDAGTNVVDVYVNYLRRKLGGEGAAVIDTVRGEGYRMALDGVRKPVRSGLPAALGAELPETLAEGLQGALRGQGFGVFGLGGRASA